ncbi:ATP-binding protein [Candidatus Woesearchaeota archaeon]|nr:ATP-binding protein [Candidatus Woesearchaeota archaeon]
MIFGNIIGKGTTKEFKFLVTGDAKKFDFVQVLNKEKYVLANILEIERDENQTIAFCGIIGFIDNGLLSILRSPLEPGSEVLYASDDLVMEILGLTDNKNGAFIGHLYGRSNIKVFLDINKLLSKHISIIAKSGFGKSYTVSVLIEELLEKKVPIVIIDPHGEYSTLKYPNDNLKDLEKLSKFGLEKRGFIENIKEYSPNIEVNTDAIPLKLSSSNVYGKELINLLPTKLSNNQLSILYSCLKDLNSNSSIDDLLIRLELEENSAKWTLINIIEYLRNQNILSDSFTPFNELVKQGTCSIINLRGVKPELQEVVVFKLLNDLFNERKKQNIAPFFLVLEEAHNFLPERSFGEAKSLPIIRQIFSEGRKFGLGACLISQRPSRVDKSCISQCTTQIVLKVTNPNDVKAVSNYVEGLTLEMEKELSNLPAGTAVITGVVDLPLVVEIRPRKSKHGGVAVDLFNEEKVENKKPLDEIEKYNNKDLIPIIVPRTTINDFRIMSGKKNVKVKLIPCAIFSCLGQDEFNIIVNLANGDAVMDFETGKGERFLFDIKDISTQQRNILNIALKFKESFTAAELFSRSNVQFSEIYDIINILTAKGYLKKEGNFYSVNRPYSNILRLPSFKCHEKIEYTSIEFNELMEDRVKIDFVKDFLSNYFKIKNCKECFLVSYY